MKLPINQIVCGDALMVMQKMPKNSIDLVLTDPPFFTPSKHYQSRITYQPCIADLSPLKSFWTSITNEVCRVLRKTGHFMTFCNCDSYPVFHEPMYNNFAKVKSLVWDKMHIGLGSIFRHRHELILWARNEGYKINSLHKVLSDVIRVKATPSEKRSHPVEKPPKLLRQLIEPTTLEGDVVLDMFCGSGTTLIASQQLRRKWIGVDLNERYVEIARQNVEKYTCYEPFSVDNSVNLLGVVE